MRGWIRCSWPCRWRGAGRCSSTPVGLHREHAGKAEVIIYDYVDDGVPVLARMHQKRLAGYRAMGYEGSIDSATTVA
jgi:hypothetical protein